MTDLDCFCGASFDSLEALLDHAGDCAEMQQRQKSYVGVAS